VSVDQNGSSATLIFLVSQTAEYDQLTLRPVSVLLTAICSTGLLCGGDSPLKKGWQALQQNEFIFISILWRKNNRVFGDSLALILLRYEVYCWDGKKTPPTR
jgi:hypothetical protein